MKTLIVSVIQYCAYWIGIDSLFYWLNRNSKRVICFHHVLPDEFGLNRVNGFEMSASSFRAVLREIRRRYDFSVDLNDAKTVTLSFDDGWRNQYTVAAPILREFNIPAMLFVAGEMVDNHEPLRALSIELLEHWIAFVPFGKYEISLNARSYVLKVHDALGRRQLWSVLRPLYLNDSERRGQGLIEALNRAYPYEKIFASLSPTYVTQRLTGITSEELKLLQTRGWCVGWHTSSHFPLKHLSIKQQMVELTCPIGFDKRVMAYPFGSHDAVDDVTTGLAEKIGFGCAFSFLVEPASRHSRFFLPRFLVSTNRYAIHFELSGCKFFLKHRTLLPKIRGFFCHG